MKLVYHTVRFEVRDAVRFEVREEVLFPPQLWYRETGISQGNNDAVRFEVREEVMELLYRCFEFVENQSVQRSDIGATSE